MPTMPASIQVQSYFVKGRGDPILCSTSLMGPPFLCSTSEEADAHLTVWLLDAWQSSSPFCGVFAIMLFCGMHAGFNCAEAVNFGPPDWLPWGTYVANKYRREGRSATLSHDALLIALVTAAPDVQKRLQREAKVSGHLLICKSGSGSQVHLALAVKEGRCKVEHGYEVMFEAQHMPHQARHARHDSLQPSVRVSASKWSEGLSMNFNLHLW